MGGEQGIMIKPPTSNNVGFLCPPNLEVFEIFFKYLNKEKESHHLTIHYTPFPCSPLSYVVFPSSLPFVIFKCNIRESQIIT